MSLLATFIVLGRTTLSCLCQACKPQAPPPPSPPGGQFPVLFNRSASPPQKSLADEQSVHGQLVPYRHGRHRPKSKPKSLRRTCTTRLQRGRRGVDAQHGGGRAAARCLVARTTEGAATSPPGARRLARSLEDLTGARCAAASPTAKPVGRDVDVDPIAYQSASPAGARAGRAPREQAGTTVTFRAVGFDGQHCAVCTSETAAARWHPIREIRAR